MDLQDEREVGYQEKFISRLTDRPKGDEDKDSQGDCGKNSTTNVIVVCGVVGDQSGRVGVT